MLVGGWVFLRWQRSRQQYAITRALIERGITRLPDGPPFWLLSLRNGMNVLMVGIGLLGVGCGAWALGSRVEMPANVSGFNNSTVHQPSMDRPGPPMEEPPGPPDGPPEDWPPPRGDRPRRPPPEEGYSSPSPRRPPAQPNPAMERWHRAQAQQSIGMVAAGCGVILCLLGAFRVMFAFVERRHIVAPFTDGDVQ